MGMLPNRKIWTWFEGEWQEGNIPILGSADHGTWLGTMVFDGARAFEGVTPDLDLHCARINHSATVMGLSPTVSTGEMVEMLGLGDVIDIMFQPTKGHADIDVAMSYDWIKDRFGGVPAQNSCPSFNSMQGAGQ